MEWEITAPGEKLPLGSGEEELGVPLLTSRRAWHTAGSNISFHLQVGSTKAEDDQP